MYVKSIVCNFRKLAKLDKLSFDWKTLKTISITNKENCRNKKKVLLNLEKKYKIKKMKKVLIIWAILVYQNFFNNFVKFSNNSRQFQIQDLHNFFHNIKSDLAHLTFIKYIPHKIYLFFNLPY